MKTSLINSKPHFVVLDGLRGVAAIIVLVYHLFEAFSIDPFTLIIGHGYLAVDFFFVLSGFVMGYAYDDRWNGESGRMTIGNFFRRRLIRLHPMVIFGTLFGAALFYFGASEIFPLIEQTSIGTVLLYTLLGMLMIPTPPSIDIRGWREMYTLDAPIWSLFFEYCANIFYALFVRRFSKTALSLLVALSALGTLYFCFTRGDVSGGWEFSSLHLQMGFSRLFFPFFAGLMIYRMGGLIKLKHTFVVCSLVLIVLLMAVPRLGGKEHLWMNGVFEAVVILVVFPLIVYAGASADHVGKRMSWWCSLLGRLSYPIYLLNYPVIYLFTAYISETKLKIADVFHWQIILFVGIILFSYLVLRYYEEPVMKWLKKKWLRG